MAANGEDLDALEDEDVDEARQSAGNWLGRWVIMLAIVAFLIVYAIQIWRGTGLTFAVLVSTAAMGVVGIVGMIARQLLLRAASQDRATSILEQMRQLSENGDDETGEDR